jgi:hypothetical protein
MQVFDYIVYYWFYLSIISFIGGILGFGAIFLAKNSDIGNPKPLFKLGIILFLQVFATVAILFILGYIFETLVSNELNSALQNPNYELYVNGKNLSNSEKKELGSKLCHLLHPPANHSGPNGYTIVHIRSNGKNFYLRLGRDTQVKTMYWVFVDNYKVTKTNEIGKIKTTILNN